MTYIGIDPGQKGFMAVYDGGWEHIPLSDELAVIARLSEIGNSGFAVVEDVHAMPGQGVSSTFKFGFNVGVIVGMLKAFKVPYSFVSPQKWQKAVWEGKDKVKTGERYDAKKTSYNAARRLFPDVDFRRTDKCKVADDNKVDATLICYYNQQTYK